MHKPELTGQPELLVQAGRTPWWVPVLACVAWVALWYFTPGLHRRGVGSLFAVDDAAQIVIETVTALILVVAILLVHGRYNRQLFAPSKLLWVYALPFVLAVALPFHYTLTLPVFLYMFWMTVSVFWQDYLTFGLLQRYLGERLPTWAVVAVVTVVFYVGHAVFIPDRFGPFHVLPALSILALGLVFALLRAWLRTLHVMLALHLAFYFLFA